MGEVLITILIEAVVVLIIGRRWRQGIMKRTRRKTMLLLWGSAVFKEVNGDWVVVA